MATVLFEKGDVFSFREGYGLVLDKDEAVLFEGKGGRLGRTVRKAGIPTNAAPIHDEDRTNIPPEVRYAMEAVLAVVA